MKLKLKSFSENRFVRAAGELVQQTFIMLLVTYLLLLLLVETIWGDSVSGTINLNYLLIVVIATGVLAVLSGPKKVVISPKQRLGWKDFGMIAGAGAVAAAIVWYKTRDIGWPSYVIAVVSGGLIVLLSVLIWHGDEKEEEQESDMKSAIEAEQAVEKAMTSQRSSRRNKLKLLVAIPILVLGYIGWVNLLPLGSTITYLIDVGAEDTYGEARLVWPFCGGSDRNETGGTTFRELEKNLVYFELDDHRLGYADEVGVRVRFKDNFPGDAKFILGAKDEKQSYYWKEVYVPFYGQLVNLTPAAEDGTIKVYATAEGSNASFESVAEFQQHPPLGSAIARNDRGVSINQRVTPEECGGIDVSQPDIGNVFPVPLAGNIVQEGWLKTDISLRRTHTFYFFATGDTVELRITKRDLNWYEGEDKVVVQIYSLDGTLQARSVIPDDGDATKSTERGGSQRCTLKVDNLERGTYRLVLSASVGDDFIITHLELNQLGLVMPGKAFLAGNLYLGEDESQSMAVWCYMFTEGKIKFHTLHGASLQTITISGEDYYETLDIHAVGTSFSTRLLKPGIYKIKAEKGDVIIEAPQGYFAFTEDSLFLPASSTNREENGALLINTALRGGHTFWTYVSNSSLELEVTKQDLNWYEGADALEIEAYSFDGELVGNSTIPDDGDEGNSTERGPLQVGNLEISGLEKGAYRLEFKGSDLLITGIKVNQQRLVVSNGIFLIGMNPAYFSNPLQFDPASLYFRDFRGNKVRFSTLHGPGLQNITILGRDLEKEVDVNKIGIWFNTTLETGDYQLIAPKQDIIIKFDGYLSFTPDSFFLPKRCEVLDLKYDLSWVRGNADYMIIDYKDYVAPVADNGWLVAQASWNIEDLFINDNKLGFCFNVPHLSQSEEKTIPVDWIEFRVTMLPVWERLPWLQELLDRMSEAFKGLPILRGRFG